MTRTGIYQGGKQKTGSYALVLYGGLDHREIHHFLTSDRVPYLGIGNLVGLDQKKKEISAILGTLIKKGFDSPLIVASFKASSIVFPDPKTVFSSRVRVTHFPLNGSKM